MVTEQNAELIVGWYKDLEERLISVIEVVPYNHDNMSVVLPKLASIVVEAGSLVDTVLREEFIGKKKKNDLSIIDFAPHYEGQYSFSEIKTLIYRYPPRYIQPFSGWVNASTNKYDELIWWKNYNRLKHNRIQEANLATLDTAMKSLCALHQVISQIDSFFKNLYRHNMVSMTVTVDYILFKRTQSEKLEDTILIESELFATPYGAHSFPDDPQKIEPIALGHSKKLRRFLVM